MLNKGKIQYIDTFDNLMTNSLEFKKLTSFELK